MEWKQLSLVALVFLIAVFLNRMFAVPQQIRLNKEILALKKRGPVCSIGISKSLWGMRIGVLIAQKDGQIMEAYRVQSKTIWGSYTLDSQFPYASYTELIQAVEKKKKPTSQELAYLNAAKYMKTGLE